MANTYKNIVITPNIGSSVEDPKIVFSGANTTVNTDIVLKTYPTQNGLLSFESNTGVVLFTIANNTSNTVVVTGSVNAASFIGSGSGLTGYSPTFTSNTSNNIVGGLANQIHYQTATGITNFITQPSNGTFLYYTTAGGFSWSAATSASVGSSNIASYEVVTTATSGTYYPALYPSTSGNLSVSANSGLSFNITTGSISANTLTSTAANGIAPFILSSNTTVANLSADFLDGLHSSYFSPLSTTQSAYAQANSKTYTFQQNTTPTSANSSDLWVNTDTGYVYENFGNTSYPIWAEFGPTSTGTGTPGAVVGTTGTFSSNVTVTYLPATTTGAGIQITAANTKGGTGYADFLQFTNTSGGATNPNKFIRLTSIGELQVVNSAYQMTSLSLTDGGDLTLAGNTTSNGIAPGYAPNRPAFRVYGANTTGPLSTTQNGTGQLNINNWAVEYSQGGYLNSSTGTFTAPVAGLYQVNLNCRNAGNASFSQLICYKNNSNVIIMIEFAGNSTMNHTGGSTVVKLASGDTLVIKVVAGTITFDGNDNWSVAYIG